MSILSEQQVIGTLLRHPDWIAKVTITTADFTDEFLGQAFSAMRAMVASGQVVDVFGVSQRMPSQDLALADLAELWKECLSNPENLEARCESLRSATRAREMAELLRVAATTLESGKDPDAIRARLITRLASLEDDGRSFVHNSEGVMRQVVDYLQEAFDAKQTGGIVGITSGIDALDSVMGGFHKSDLVIVGGRPAMGKTGFMASLAWSAASSGKRVGIASAEMPAVQIGLRMVSMLGKIPSTKIRSCDLDEQEFSRLTSSASTYRNLPIEIYDKPACTPGDIALQARAWQLSGGLDILFVDYLTRLNPDDRDSSRTREVGQMVASLKTLAKSLNVPVVCLAQLSRECEKRSDKRPIMADLRDSGEIEQEADAVIFLYRDAVYNESAAPDSAEILLEKNRHGPCGTVHARFIPEQMFWTNPWSDDGRSG